MGIPRLFIPLVILFLKIKSNFICSRAIKLNRHWRKTCFVRGREQKKPASDSYVGLKTIHCNETARNMLNVFSIANKKALIPKNLIRSFWFRSDYDQSTKLNVFNWDFVLVFRNEFILFHFFFSSYSFQSLLLFMLSSWDAKGMTREKNPFRTRLHFKMCNWKTDTADMEWSSHNIYTLNSSNW